MHRKAYIKAPFKNIAKANAKRCLGQMFLLLEEFKL